MSQLEKHKIAARIEYAAVYDKIDNPFSEELFHQTVFTTNTPQLLLDNNVHQNPRGFFSSKNRKQGPYVTVSDGNYSLLKDFLVVCRARNLSPDRFLVGSVCDLVVSFPEINNPVALARGYTNQLNLHNIVLPTARGLFEAAHSYGGE